jgi:hypothetical protein
MSKENMNVIISEEEVCEVAETTQNAVEVKKPGIFGRIRQFKEDHPVLTSVVGGIVKVGVVGTCGYLLGSKQASKKYASYELGSGDFVDADDSNVTEDYAE